MGVGRVRWLARVELGIAIAAGLMLAAIAAPPIARAGPLLLERPGALDGAALAVVLLAAGLYLIGLGWIFEIATEEV